MEGKHSEALTDATNFAARIASAPWCLYHKHHFLCFLCGNWQPLCRLYPYKAWAASNRESISQADPFLVPSGLPSLQPGCLDPLQSKDAPVALDRPQTRASQRPGILKDPEAISTPPQKKHLPLVAQ